MRVLRRALIAVPLTVLSLAAAPAWAETLGDARVGFSAERVLVIDGQSYIGRMWHMPGEQRHEQDLPALRPIFILRADSAIGDIILPKLHTVVEFALPKEMSIFGDPGLLRKPVGPETVNGIATTKYEVDEKNVAGPGDRLVVAQPGRHPDECDARLATDKGKVSTIRWELRHVKIGTQDAALFEITARLRKAVAGGGRPIARHAAGASPRPIGSVGTHPIGGLFIGRGRSGLVAARSLRLSRRRRQAARLSRPKQLRGGLAWTRPDRSGRFRTDLAQIST